jgi:hypothetical protein
MGTVIDILDFDIAVIGTLFLTGRGRTREGMASQTGVLIQDNKLF